MFASVTGDPGVGGDMLLVDQGAGEGGLAAEEFSRLTLGAALQQVLRHQSCQLFHGQASPVAHEGKLHETDQAGHLARQEFSVI